MTSFFYLQDRLGLQTTNFNQAAAAAVAAAARSSAVDLQAAVATSTSAFFNPTFQPSSATPPTTPLSVTTVTGADLFPQLTSASNANTTTTAPVTGDFSLVTPVNGAVNSTNVNTALVTTLNNRKLNENSLVVRQYYMGKDTICLMAEPCKFCMP